MSQTVSTAWGTRAAYPNVTNLNSQPSAASRTIGAVDATATTPANPVGFKVDYTFKTATTGVTTTGTISVYLLESADGGTTYTDGMNAATTTDQTSSIKNATAIKTIQANANSQTCTDTFDLPRNFCPKNHTLLIQNGTGAALLSSGNTLSVTPINFTVG